MRGNRRKYREQRRKRNKAIRMVIVSFIVVIAGIMAVVRPVSTNKLHLPISSGVKSYSDTIKKYANKYDISEYVGLIEAVMMQESKGKGTDPMQAAEGNYNDKYSKKPGGIKDPEYSIDCGVHQLADALKMVDCDGPDDVNRLELAVQGYNYGDGYITWAMKKYGEYSEDNAKEFADKMKHELNLVTYGDKYYVKHVMRYYSY